MLKNVRKSRILLSLMVGILTMVLFGNVYSLATDTSNTSNTAPLTITASTADNTNAAATNTNTANVNNSINTSNVAAPTTNTNNTNKNTNTNTNNTNNASTYNNANTVKNTTKLPRTGSNNSKAILLIVVFAISAVYAYKKVSDYNM